MRRSLTAITIATVLLLAAATAATGERTNTGVSAHGRPSGLTVPIRTVLDRPGVTARPPHIRPASATASRVARRGCLARRYVRTIQLAGGAIVKRLEMSEPAGVIRLLRVAVPRADRMKLTATIPQLVSVSLVVPAARRDPSESCRVRGGTEVCTQWVEACPMPQATWTIRLDKHAGPAGEVKFAFAVT